MSVRSLPRPSVTPDVPDSLFEGKERPTVRSCTDSNFIVALASGIASILSQVSTYEYTTTIGTSSARHCVGRGLLGAPVACLSFVLIAWQSFPFALSMRSLATATSNIA